MKLGKLALAMPLLNANLTARFAFHSFFCIGIMTVALWFIVSSYLIDKILEREWSMTAELVRADVKEYLTTADFTSQDRKSVGHKFDTLLKHIRLMPDIVRFRVYNPKGVVIWSDDKRLVGKSFPDNGDLKDALKGKIVAEMSALTNTKNVFEQASPSTVVEVYFPIYSDNGTELLGVFETHKNAEGIYRDIHKARMVVLMGAVGGGLLLYFSLFAIVRQAAKKIDEQQENLLQMQAKLVASQHMAAMGEVAAAVAHGIGNPLSSIRAAAQVAMLDTESAAGPEKNKKMAANLQNIMRQVDRVQKRMQGLLNFAKPLEPHPVAVEVNSLLRDVVETLQPRFGDAQVVSELEIDATLPSIKSDVNHLEQVFMGLILNAVEATPKGGKVTIRTESAGSNGNGKAVRISVVDNGEGIPVANRERVFEPFFTTKPHGTGIGLPLAKKFVERNGGTIAIADEPGAGTKIDITFPIAN